MPRCRAILAIAALAWSAPCAAQAKQRDARVLFTGDIMLSRQVQVEIERRRVSPWTNVANLFHSADLVAGNFEGAIGPSSDCVAPESGLCFATPPAAAKHMARSGFKILSIENNHSGDLGAAGRTRTHEAFRAAGVLGLDFDRSPQFVRIGGLDAAVIAVTLVRAADGRVQQIPSTEMAQKLRLARQLSNFVIVSIHWGNELQDWHGETQRAQAEWLVDNGADLVVGHHPHVVQAADCIHGAPVFFSLGNHVFDQKYPETKDGEIADCRLHDGRVHCGVVRTHTAPSTAMPRVVGEANVPALAACSPPAHALLQFGAVTLRVLPWSPVNDQAELVLGGWMNDVRQWETRRQHVLSVQTGLATNGGGSLLFTLERHPSTIDGENGVRPYVYDLGPHGLVARWRGSALAWPLLDAVVDSAGRLCALHRGDAFITLDTASTATKIARYDWNGFGFSAAADTVGNCARYFTPRDK